MRERDSHDYFLPRYYAEHGYMPCMQVTGIQAVCSTGLIDLHWGSHVRVNGQAMQVAALLGEIDDADAGRPVWPLIVVMRHIEDETYTHYALDDLLVDIELIDANE